MGHGHQQEQAAAQAIPVDHDVQGEKYRAQDIGDDRHDTAGELEGAHDAHRHHVADAQVAEQVRQGAGQLEALQPVRQAFAQDGLLIDQVGRLLDQCRNGQGDEQHGSHHDPAEHDGDAQAPAQAPLFQPADRGANGADDDERQHQHQEHGHEPAQPPQSGDEERQDDEGAGSEFDANHSAPRLLWRTFIGSAS
ncbi:hypothetical protein D3C78_1158130 [compost metagenome]